mgnify:CR=1 FL=1
MTSQQTQLQQYVNNSTNSDIVQFTNNQNMNQLSELANMNLIPPNIYLNKSNQFPSNEIGLNKLTMNSSLNIPSLNIGANISLNEQVLNQQKEQNDYFDKDVSVTGEVENDPVLEEYATINNRKNQAIYNIKNISIRIKNNKLKIEELKKKLNNLKKEKNQKQGDIINLLSNKESIEEIYKNQIYLLTNHLSGNFNNNNNFDENITLNNDINNLTNTNIKNDMIDNSAINLNSIHNITIIDNEMLNNDEDNFKISLKEIKESDQKIFVKQVIYLFEDIFKKRDDKINISITNIINNSYELFINNNSGENDNENNDLILNNFFGKMSLFISNHSLGKYSESKINLFLRYLMKINTINVRLTKYLKFVNKKYKEQKKDLTDMINFLEKKNINLTEKKHRLENNMKEYADRLEFLGTNEDIEMEQNYEGVDYLDEKNIGSDIYNYDIKSSNVKKLKRIKNKKSNTVGALNIRENIKKEIEKLENNKDEKIEPDDRLEYEDGIWKNDKINYEDDSIDESNSEEENEMINQRLNPFNSYNQMNINKKKNSFNYKQNNKINDKKQIFLDNDESDTYLSQILQNNKNKGLFGENKSTFKRNSKNVIKAIPRNNNNQSLNYKSKTNNNFLMNKKLTYNNFNNISANIISDKSIFPVNQNQTQYNGNDLGDQLTSIELEHYKRVQRIMNANPNVSNIFGVNNYNPENHVNTNKDIFFSDNKNQTNSNNKIDKTIRYGSRKNHNFISIINMTKNTPINKNNEKEKSKNKEKLIKNKDIDNDGGLKIINLEDNFLNDISNDAIKNENENENKINESTSMLTKSNNVESNTNSKLVNVSHGSKNNDNNKSNIIIVNESNENSDNINIVSKMNERKNNNNDTNEIQGYFINIINSKEDNKEKKNSINNVINNKDKDNINSKIDTKEFFNNISNIKTLKITKSKELNIKDIKNNKLTMITKKNISKALHTKKGIKPKTKLIQIRNRDTKKTESLNKTQFISKPNASLYKTTLESNIIPSNISYENKSANNSFVNINDTSINKNSDLKEYQSQGNFNTIDKNKKIKKAILKNKKSPNNMKKGKYLNIPISSNKTNNNRNYNSNTYDNKIKTGLKTDKPK